MQKTLRTNIPIKQVETCKKCGLPRHASASRFKHPTVFRLGPSARTAKTQKPAKKAAVSPFTASERAWLKRKTDEWTAQQQAAVERRARPMPDSYGLRRAELVTTIKAAGKGFTDAELKGLKTDSLARLAQGLGVKTLRQMLAEKLAETRAYDARRAATKRAPGIYDIACGRDIITGAAL